MGKWERRALSSEKVSASPCCAIKVLRSATEIRPSPSASKLAEAAARASSEMASCAMSSSDPSLAFCSSADQSGVALESGAAAGSTAFAVRLSLGTELLRILNARICESSGCVELLNSPEGHSFSY